MDRLETNGYYALGIPAYFLLIAIEVAISKARGVRVYRFADTIGNLGAGLGEIVLGLFLAPYLLALYDLGFAQLALIHWPKGAIAPWIIAFFAADLGYYWYHRAGHRVGVLWAIHGVHHQSEQFNVSIAMRHPWFSDVYSFPFYVLLPVLGVTALQFFVAISAISFYALSVHTQIFHRPGFFIFVTPATHIVHHCRNPRYLGKNLGAMFTLWDRLFGTHVELDPADPPQLGTPVGYQTHDGARSQWIFFRDIIANARRAANWREALKAFFSYPNWRPKGAPPLARPAARPDEAIPRGLKHYVTAQFGLTVVFSTLILWKRSLEPLGLQVFSAAMILWSIAAVGGLLDGRRGALRWEIARLCGILGLGATWVVVRSPLVGVLVALGGAIGLTWLSLARLSLGGHAVDPASDAGKTI